MTVPEFDFEAGFKRLAEALAGQAGALPFTAQMHEFAMAQSGLPAKQFYGEPEALVRGALSAARDFGFDLPNLGWDVYNIEAEALGQRVVYFDDLTPACDNAAPLIAEAADLARLKPPDPETAGRMPHVLETLGRYRELTGHPAEAGCCAPFTCVCQLMGFEKVVRHMFRNPAFLKEVLSFVTEEVIAPYVKTLLAAFPETPSVAAADALSSLPFLSEDMQAEYSIPYIERLRELVGDRVAVNNWWGDAHARDLDTYLESKLRISPRLLKCQDPDLDKVGPEAVRKFAVARDVTLVLGVDNNLLHKGPVAEIESRIERYLQAGDGARFVLYFCNLGAQTPVEHVHAAVAAVRRYRGDGNG